MCVCIVNIHVKQNGLCFICLNIYMHYKTLCNTKQQSSVARVNASNQESKSVYSRYVQALVPT